MRVGPVTLRGENVHLEPLSQVHAQGLYNRGRESGDWAYLPRPCFVDQADVRQWIEEALAIDDQVCFAIVEQSKGRVVGSTRYMDIRPEHRSLEIGWSWLGRDWQRTAVNTQTKLLLLTHAFERLHCLRVAFKTDARNERSQTALARIGAVREGVLRNHMTAQNNVQRDSVYFSIIAPEWPTVKERLLTLCRS